MLQEWVLHLRSQRNSGAQNVERVLAILEGQAGREESRELGRRTCRYLLAEPAQGSQRSQSVSCSSQLLLSST